MSILAFAALLVTDIKYSNYSKKFYGSDKFRSNI